jgi:hypothetical protein
VRKSATVEAIKKGTDVTDVRKKRAVGGGGGWALGD